MMRFSRSRLFRALRREDGTASIEFVIMVPIVVTIFMASVEAGFYMAKHVMMERGLDMVIRQVRLGNLVVSDADVLRDAICEATPILKDCETILKIETTPVDMATFNMPAVPTTCVNRGDPSPPPGGPLDLGGSNEMMLVRICAVQDPIFPSTGIGLEMAKDDLGGYQMVSASVYVNEPR